MDLFLQQLVNGLSTGSIYVLVAIGVTLVFGVSKLINFAHGQFVVLGSFFTYTLIAVGVPFWVAIVPSAAAVGLVGIGVDRLLLRRTLEKPVNGLIVSLGLVIMLEGLLTEVWSHEPRKIAAPVGGVLAMGTTRVPAGRIVTFVVVGLGVAALFYILQRTDAGRSMRAARDNPDAAALVGVDVGRSIMMSFLVGAVLAGLAGSFLATLFPFTPYTGTSLMVKGLAVAIIAGLGSVGGALIIGLALGVAEALGSAYLIGSEWQNGYAYVAMALLLVWRPSGLFGGNREY